MVLDWIKQRAHSDAQMLDAAAARDASPGRVEDPDDEQLLAWAREGRVLVSLVFWTGMIRETENLYALTDLLAMSGLQAGIVLTVQSLTYRPRNPVCSRSFASTGPASPRCCRSSSPWPAV